MKSQRSSMTLYQPLAFGGAWIADISRHCWPSYRRTSLAMGGDAQATFRFTAPSPVLDRWFADALGGHFVETFAGVTAFAGQVQSLYYSHHGDVDSLSLKGVYNSIFVKYKTSSSATAVLTASAADARSVARYGTRTLIYDLGTVYVNGSTATAVRDDLLGEIAWPLVQNESVDVDTIKSTPVLSVTVRGYAESLDGVLLTNAATTSSTVSAEIKTALVAADFVTAGQIAANATQVTVETDYEGAWQRVKGLAGLRGGGSWFAGCYQGRKLDYFEADLDSVAYYLAIADKVKRVFADGGLAHVAALPLVKPGRMAFRNYMAGRSVDGTLRRDPRALFIRSLTYDRSGLALKGLDSTGVAQSVALQMALDGER